MAARKYTVYPVLWGGSCQCGCGLPTRIAPYTRTLQGWVGGQPVPFRLNHKPSKLLDTHVIDPVSGCWMWPGVLSKEGYGRIRRFGKLIQAHRVYYERVHGQIPDGLDIDHLCHTRDKTCPGGITCLHRRCVNPDHLAPVTLPENVRRGRNAKLTDAQVREIRAARGKAGYRELAKRYGVRPQYIHTLWRGEAWDGSGTSQPIIVHRPTISPDMRATILAARGQELAEPLSRRLGVGAATVRRIWSTESE